MHTFYSSQRSSTDESKCFLSHRKKKFYVEVLYPIDINFTFYRTVNELGSIIHTLNKNSQIPASSKIPAKAIGKNFHHNS